MNGLEINITKQLGDLSIRAEIPGSDGVTALFGVSGAGKSSILRMVAGLMVPEVGRIVLDDVVLFDSERKINLPARQRRLGVVFQDALLFPHMSVAKNLQYGGNHDEAQIVDLLGLADLLARLPGDLSGGERQRVALGRAMMSAPKALLLDEPLASLDARRKAEILPYLERLRDGAGVPILYISHAINEVARLADTLVLVSAGKTVMAGGLGAVLGDPASLAILGPEAAGGVLFGQIERYVPDEGLTYVTTDAGGLILPGQVGAPGGRVRLHVPAHEIILSRQKPEGLSALNVLPAQVAAAVDQGPAGVAVALKLGENRLLARLTAHSVRALDIVPGADVFAIIKATALTKQ